MTSIKDYIKVELINESNEVTRELFVKNTVENPAWYTVEDNVSIISENVERIVKIETDILDDCVWETNIEIPKVVNDHNSLLSLEYQNISESSDLIYTDRDNDNHVKTFCCNVCRKAFNTSIQFENHMDKHKKLAKDYKCDFCGKTFKLNFGLNRHVQKYHLPNNGNGHKSIEKKTDCILNLKLCKLNGVWKSKPNFVYKCNVCFEKFHNENNLMEHVKIHDQDNGQVQCEVCLKVISVSELNYHMKLIHSKNSFACLKCNLSFDKKQNLKRHFHRCTKRSLSKFQSKHKNAVKALFVCTVCRIGFSSSFRLKFHIISGCKYRSCKYGRKTFSAKNLWSKHMYEYGKYKKCVNVNKTSVNEIHNENMMENNCHVDIENSRPCTNVLESSSSNNMDLGTDRELTVQAVSIDNVLLNSCIMKSTEDNSVHANVTKNNNSVGVDGTNSTEMTMQIAACNSAENDSDGLNIKGNDYSSSSIDVAERIFSDQMDVANSNESVLETLLPHNSTENNYNAIVVKIERNEFTNFMERNDLDSVGVENNEESIEPGVSHSLMIDYCRPIKVEKIVSLNDTERNSSNCAANDIEPTVVMNVPLSRIVNIKQEPNDLVNDDAVSMASSVSSVLCTENLSNTEIVERPVFDGLGNVVFTCKVCGNSTNERHTFALHMSCHSNSNLHECVVCDTKFPSEYLWQKHLMFHREKQHLILMSSRMDAQSNNTTDFMHANIQTHNNANFKSRSNQVTPKIKHNYNNYNANVTTNLNNEAKQIRRQFFCSTCENVFPSKLTLIEHQTAVHISCMFSCRHCDRTFSKKGLCTNHEKSHKLDTSQQPLINAKGSSLKPNEMPYDIEPENNNDRPFKRIYRRTNNKPLKTSQTFCNICKRKFTKQCYWTNHMKLLHKINPHSLKEQQQVLLSDSSNVNDNVNGEKCINTSKILEESKKRPSVVTVVKTLSNSSNNIKDKSSYCTICMKQFAHIGALTSHMHIHSDLKPYECRYCNRKFSMKGPYTIHEKSMKCEKDGQKRSYSENSLVKDSLQTENYSCELVDGAGTESTNNVYSARRKRVWFVCDVCDKKFSTPDRLIIHRKLHRGNEPFLCKICNKLYAFRCHWNRHLKSHYLKNNTLVKKLKSHQQTDNVNLGTYNGQTNAIQHESKYKCVYCKKEYKLMSHWKKHLSLNKECRRHGKMSLVAFASTKTKIDIRRKCKICLKTYSTAYNCKAHMINVHKHFDTGYSDNTNVEGAGGGTIGEDFHDTDAENSHDIDTRDVDVETINPALLKPVARKPIAVKRRRRRRQQIAGNENRHQCDICERSYSNKTNLSRHHNHCHMLDVHINCNICGANFKHNYSYQQHMRYRHKLLEVTGDSDVATKIAVTNVVSMNKNYIEKYSCAVCKMAFADDSAFQTHKKTHVASGYACNDCGQLFETNITLGEHILQSHDVNVVTNDNNERAENGCSIPNYFSSSAGPSVSRREIYPKVLKTGAHLSNHVKLFKCGRCDAAFRFKQNLIVHKRKHYLESRLAGDCEVLF